MSNFAVVNIEQLERQRFLVANLYKDGQGSLINQIIVAFDGYPAALTLLKEAGVRHVWTSDRRIYGAILKDTTLAGELKHKGETAETASAIGQNAELLRDIFSIPAAGESKPAEVGRFRRWLADQLIKLSIIIGGTN